MERTQTSVGGRDARNQAWPEQRPCYYEQVLCWGPGVSGLNQRGTGLGNLTTGPGASASCTSVWETLLNRFPLAQGLQGPRRSQRQAFQVSDSPGSHPDSLHPSLGEEQAPGLLPPQPCFEPRSPGLTPWGSPLPTQGGWGLWSPWSPCSGTCTDPAHPAWRSRSRLCLANCTGGAASQERPCNLPSCTGAPSGPDL